MNKVEFLQALHELHETEDPINDIEEVVNQIEDKYARGYLIAKIESQNKEDFKELKEDIESWTHYYIWNK